MKKHLPLIIVLILIAGSIYYLESGKVRVSGEVQNADIKIGYDYADELDSIEQKAEKYQRAKELVQPGQFFNTENGESVTIEQFIGKKIVMVDFWTYSCINCQRTLPYLNAWHEKYGKNLVILGVHSPEFDFEKDPANVQDAIDRFGIEYPVVQDNNFGTWRAYKNRYWPRKYLIDIDGFIVYDHIGEGAYDSTERKIQELLIERSKRLDAQVGFESDSLVDPVAPKKTSNKRISPEVYLGASRNKFLVNADKGVVGSQSVSEARNLDSGELQLIGDWDIQSEFATNTSADAKIQYAYNAHDVFMVLSAERSTRVKVMVDGEVVNADIAGDDVDSDGYLVVQKEGLYKILKGDDNTNRLIELVIEEPGLKAFTFTFG